MLKITVTDAARAISDLINSRSSSPRLDELEAIIARVGVRPPLAAIETSFVARVRTAVEAAREAMRRYAKAAPEDDERNNAELDLAEDALLALEAEIPRPALEPEHQLALALIASYRVAHYDRDEADPEARCAFRLLEGQLLAAGEIADTFSERLDPICRARQGFADG